MLENDRIDVVSLLYDDEDYEAADDLVAGYIIAVLRETGYRVNLKEIRDGHEQEDIKTIIDEPPGIVVFTVPRTSNMQEISFLCKQIKEARKDCTTVLTGWSHHSAPYDASKLLRKGIKLDVIIRGEGDATIVELVDLLRGKSSLEECLGITYRDDDGIHENPDRPVIEPLDSLPFPARDSQEMHPYDTMWISSARGCLGNCSFCAVPASRIPHAPVWRGRSPENVLNELIELNQKYNVSQFNFLDPTFEDPGKKGKERIRKLAELIIDAALDITILVHMRAENWTEDDRELLDLLFQAGLETVLVGLESGNQECLRLFNKRATVDTYYRFFSLISKYHLYIDSGFIMFHPYATFDMLRDNADFLRTVGQAHILCTFNSKLYLFPKTAIYEKIKADNMLLEPTQEFYTLYDYEFLDPRIKRLSGKMDMVDSVMSESMFFHYKSVIRLITYTSRMQRTIMKLGEAGNALCEDYRKMAVSVDRLTEKIGAINCEWFLACLKWAENEESDSVFMDLLSAHLAAIEVYVQPVQQEQFRYGFGFQKALRKISAC